MNDTVAWSALTRARELVGQLDWSRKTEDLDRVQAGIKHELETAMVALQAAHPGALVDTVGLVRNDHGDTAQAAAKAIKLRSGTQRASVLLELLHLGKLGWAGDTDEGLQCTLAMGASSERPRRVELVRMGYVEDSGKRKRTLAGLDAVVWTITEAGRAAARKLEIQDPLPFEAAIRESQGWQDAEELFVKPSDVKPEDAQVPEVTGLEDLAQLQHVRW